MISQNSLESKSPWLPTFRSFASECAFLAFSSGMSTVWSKGQMIYNCPDVTADDEHYRELRKIYGEASKPDWTKEVLSKIDNALPSEMTIVNSLDECSLVISSYPAPFRLPQTPCPHELGKCIFASRVLAAIRSELIFPLDMEEADAIDELDQAAHLSVMIGGERAIATAFDYASNRRNFLA